MFYAGTGPALPHLTPPSPATSVNFPARTADGRASEIQHRGMKEVNERALAAYKQNKNPAGAEVKRDRSGQTSKRHLTRGVVTDCF